MSKQWSRGGVGSRKHGKGGHPDHDLHAVADIVNDELETRAQHRKRKRGTFYASVRELMERRRRSR